MWVQEKCVALQKDLSDTESDLSDTRAALASRCQELSTLTETWTSKLNDVAARHNDELTAERQKALEVVHLLRDWFHCSISLSVLGSFWQKLVSARDVKKLEWWSAGVVICLVWGADDLHVVQLMPLPPRYLFFSLKSSLVLPFWCQVVVE